MSEKEKTSSGFLGLGKLSKNIGVLIAVITGIGFIGNWVVNAVSEYQGYQKIKEEIKKISLIESRLELKCDSLEKEISSLKSMHNTPDSEEWIVTLLVRDGKLLYRDFTGEEFRVLFNEQDEPYYIDDAGYVRWCW